LSQRIMWQSSSISKILFVFTTFLMAKARPMDGLYFATRPIHSHNHPGAPVIPKPYYNYGYSVQDKYSGNNYNAQETADGKDIIGSYQVHLPDGRLQTVKYTANHYTGYVPEITYEGQAVYDDPKPGPSYHDQPPSPRPFYNINKHHSKTLYYKSPKKFDGSIQGPQLHNKKTTLYDVHEPNTTSSFKIQPKDDHPSQRVTIYDPTTLYRSNVPAKPKAKANA